jgi:hypothetical protein
VLTDDASALARGVTGIENSAQLTAETVEVGQLSLKECPDVDTRPRLGAPKRDDVPDLREGES